MATPPSKHRHLIGVFIRLEPEVIVRSRVLMHASRVLGLGRLTWGDLFCAGLLPTERRLREEADRRGFIWADLVLAGCRVASARRRKVPLPTRADPDGRAHDAHMRPRPTGYFP